MTAITHIPVPQNNSRTTPLLITAQVYRRRRIGVSALLAVTVFIFSFLGGELLSGITSQPESLSLGATSEASVYVAEDGNTP